MNEKIFSEEIEIPKIVREKADAAFSAIKNDEVHRRIENDVQKEAEPGNNRFLRLHTRAAAAVIAALLCAGGITAYAAIRHFWSPGLESAVSTTEEQKENLEKEGIVSFLDGDNAVTSDGITIKPLETVADGKYAVITFAVYGLDPEYGTDILFGSVSAFADSEPVNLSGSFYSEMIFDENEEKAVEYVMYVAADTVNGKENTLSGKTLHVSLNDLGTAGKAEIKEQVSDGNWEFDIPLDSTGQVVVYDLQTEPDSSKAVTVEHVTISPVSIRIEYSVNNSIDLTKDADAIPLFSGVVLKDGTVLEGIGGIGATGFADTERTKAFSDDQLTTVIDPNEGKR